jgi:hypothetical protein
MKKTHLFTTPTRNVDLNLADMDDAMSEDNWQQKSRAMQARRWKKLKREQ